MATKYQVMARADMPSKNKIRLFWSVRIDLEKKGFYCIEEFIEDDYCFACGFLRGKTERAHINALCEGGSNHPENLHLLCSECHKDSEFISGDDYWEWFYTRSILDVIDIAIIKKHGFLKLKEILKTRNPPHKNPRTSKKDVRIPLKQQTIFDLFV